MATSEILAQQRDQATERRLYEDAATRAARYRAEITERSVAPLPEGVAGLTRFDEEFPEGGTDPFEVISRLDEIGSPATMGMAGPRFFGFVIGASLPVTVAANWLATAWDQNTGLYTATPGTSKLEEVCLLWLNEIFGFPPSTGAAFVTGATMANFTALAAARSHVLKNAGWDVEADGLFGAPEIMVVIGEEAHPTLIKALGLLGLGRNRTVIVPADNQGRMRADRFPEVKSPAIVCIQSGNVNTGSFDPATSIIASAHNAGAWVHVDGAFGLWAAASPALAHLAEGLNAADSWATDAHKWLNVPYDSGIAFVREAEQLRTAMSLTAAYLPMTPQREPSQYTPELSRRARGVEIWAALRTLGRRGLREMIEQGCNLARRFAVGLEAGGYEILNEVALNQVLVSFGPPETTRRVIERIQQDGTCWCGGTVWQGRTAMRISVSGWSTTTEDVDRSLAVMLRLAAEENGRAA
jgi:glutamate/tyrosine decarboxylase-like PLP-dependent enzyme